MGHQIQAGGTASHCGVLPSEIGYLFSFGHGIDRRMEGNYKYDPPANRCTNKTFIGKAVDSVECWRKQGSTASCLIWIDCVSGYRLYACLLLRLTSLGPEDALLG